MTSTRCGISAKQLERELGVSYRTAWRMMNQIRNELMADDGEPLAGDVEVDETSWGGKPRSEAERRSEAAAFRESKTTVLGMVERGGKVRVRVIASRRGPALSREVKANINPTSILYTDDWQAYKPLKREFLDHRIINHSAGSVRGRRHPHEHHRRVLRQLQDRDARGLSEDFPEVAASPTWTSTPGATTSATPGGRCSTPSLIEAAVQVTRPKPLKGITHGREAPRAGD